MAQALHQAHRLCSMTTALASASAPALTPVLRPFRRSSSSGLKSIPATAASFVASTSTLAHPRLANGRYAQELVDAAEAVRLASRLCETVQRQLSTAEKTDKSDDSPVTVADYAAQAVVAWALSRSSAACQGGKLSMVAEEDSADLRQPEGRPMLLRITQLINSVIAAADPNAHLSPEDVIDLIDLGGSQGGPSGRHWVLDPIDGTRGFVGMRQYSVCLGMLQDGVVEVGLLGCPNLPQGAVRDEDGGSAAMGLAGAQDVGSLFVGHRGHGAYAVGLQGAKDLSDVQPIHVKDLTDLSHARFMESWESRHSDHSFTAAVAREMGVVLPPLRMDSQVKYGLLSRGEASIFMRFPPSTYKEKIWDHCAGFVIVEEAGGKVTDGSGKRLDFSHGRYLKLDTGIVAGPPTVHAAIVAAIKAVKAKKQQAAEGNASSSDYSEND